MRIKIKKLNPDAVLPRYAHPDDAGMDVCAAEELTIPAGEWRAVSTGLSMELPSDAEVQIRPRSGLAFRCGVTVLNAPGTIDAGYRGELKILLINHGKEPFVIRKGDRIAQMVVSTVIRPEIECVDTLSDSDRGEGGFGSTGR